MSSQKATLLFKNRAGERGAALITATLLSLLLLAAGGTLILTATMTGITARDSTAEMQAYYAAEAGVAKTLEVLRGNVESNPAGTRATFRNVVCSPNLWTTMSGAVVNVVEDGSIRYRVTLILDPDNLDSDLMCNGPNAANYRPLRLTIQVAGFGPRDSRKNMEVAIDRYTVDYEVNAVVTLPNGTANPMAFALGGSNVTTTSGVDISGTGTTLSAYSVSDVDYNRTNNVIDGCLPDGTNCGNGPNVTPGDPTILGETNTPSFLESVTKVRQFLYGSEGMMQTAINQGRYFTTEAAAKASAAGLGANTPDGVLTFVDGDLTLPPGSPSGQGTLIVTGNLILDGNFNWNGVIMVLGTGNVLRSGGGTGNIFGAVFVANFAKTGSDTDVFGTPTFNTNGGGTSNIQYSSFAVDMAKSVGGHAIHGVREF
jgi:hypothetical protein